MSVTQAPGELTLSSGTCMHVCICIRIKEKKSERKYVRCGACNPSDWEVEAKDVELRLNVSYTARLDYMRPCSP